MSPRLHRAARRPARRQSAEQIRAPAHRIIAHIYPVGAVRAYVRRTVEQLEGVNRT